jgi:P-type conjugative transfer ATPase TrbB
MACVKAMDLSPALSASKQRLYEKLYQDLGEDLLSFLQDKSVHEVMLNPDGKIWVDNPLEGLIHQGYLSAHRALSIIHTVAGIQGTVVTAHSPRLEAELPFFKSLQGERFTAQIPPLVAAPSFTIRKKSETIFSLADYVTQGRLSPKQAEVLKDLIRQRQNILVCGGPGSGKTTVTNALMGEAVKQDLQQRILILEDLPELQCFAPNVVSMLTSEQVNLTALLRTAMRMRPDRILIGEVRGAEALDLLKAWNTGCPGGMCTVHANDAVAAVQRIVDLAMEAGLSQPPVGLVLQTIHAVVSVQRRGNQKGFIQEILTLGDYVNGKFVFEKLA